MKRLFSIAVIMTLLCFCLANYVCAYWIWTPETKRWINPKYAVRPTPEEQLEYAQEFFERREYQEALKEYRKLIRHYPQSLQAAEAQYYIGACLENLGKLYEAYLAYQKGIDKYAFTERLEEIVERQYKIGERFLEGERRKILGIAIPLDNPAIEVFRKVIENSPYGRYAPLAQYKIALCLKGMGRFGEAKEEFQKVVDNYPESSWAEAAKFQIALCDSQASLGVDYDQESVKEAKEGFEEFIRAHPDAELTEEAQQRVKELKDKEAEKEFHIAQFYEKQRAYESAKLYYRYIIKNYPESLWATKAEEKLQAWEEE